MLKYEIVDNNKEDWVVFIHGIGGSTKTWKKQVDSFSKKFNLLLLDLPGHGSNSNNIIHSVDSKRLNKGIKETLNHLKIKAAHFVGLSLGTIVVAQFAVQNPSYVKSIIMGGSALLLRGFQKSYVWLANAMKRIVPYKFLYQFFAWFLLPKSNHKKSRKIFLREVVKLDKETMYAWIDYLKYAVNPGKLFEQLNQLGKKILFISGDEDHCFLRGVKLINKKIKSSDLKIIAHCGHVCSIEKADEFNMAAVEYLAA